MKSYQVKYTVEVKYFSPYLKLYLISLLECAKTQNVVKILINGNNSFQDPTGIFSAVDPFVNPILLLIFLIYIFSISYSFHTKMGKNLHLWTISSIRDQLFIFATNHFCLTYCTLVSAKWAKIVIKRLHLQS